MRTAIPSTRRTRRTGAGKALIGLSSILLALSGATSASAQTETPVRGMSESDAARATIIDFARCTVRSHRAVVEHLLTKSPLDKGSQYALGKLADSDCMSPGDLQIPYSLMRGGLYAALYMADYDFAPPVSIITPLDFTADVGGAATPEAQQYLWLHQFADCVVRADPQDSRALVLAGVANPSESAMFAALAPHFSGCMVKGQSLTFSKAVLAGLIAEVLYRQTKAASVRRSGS